MYQFDRKEYEKRMEWYQDARFGMFIHWGLYSIPARGEWVRSVEEIPEEEYLPFMKEFDARDYNPKQWAKEAKAAGMKYVVLTAKHHDGFCLFDSKYTDYKVTNTPAGRDLIKEYVEALREEGLKVGIYFTLLDWHHPDYPHYGDRIQYHLCKLHRIYTLSCRHPALSQNNGRRLGKPGLEDSHVGIQAFLLRMYRNPHLYAVPLLPHCQHRYAGGVADRRCALLCLVLVPQKGKQGTRHKGMGAAVIVSLRQAGSFCRPVLIFALFTLRPAAVS